DVVAVSVPAAAFDARPALAGVRDRADDLASRVTGAAIRLRGRHAEARRRVARSRHRALVHGCAHHRVLRRVGADPGRRIAGAGDVAGVDGDAHDRVRAGAIARLARVRLRAGVTVVAHGALGQGRVRAPTRVGVADPHVTLVLRRTHDRVAADAAPSRARIALRAGVAVVAPRPIDARAVPAGTGDRVAGVDRARIGVAA